MAQTSASSPVGVTKNFSLCEETIKLKRFFFMAIVVTLLLATALPATAFAAGKPVKLKINNLTGAKVYLTLQGPKTYYVNLAIAQKLTQEVEPGKYTYTYTACGGTQKGTINIKSAETLKLPACKNAGTGSSSTKLAKVKINNKTGGVLTLRLTGTKNYYFSFQPGITKIEVVEGKYSYTVYGCGGSSKSGTIKLKPGFQWSWFCR